MNCREFAVMLAATGIAACGSAGEVPRASATIAACGVEFEALPGWALADTSVSAHGCTIRLDLEDRARRDSSDIVGEFQVSATVLRGPTDSIAAEWGFARRDSGWVVLGRLAEASPAVEYGRGEWRGVQGIAGVGCSSRIDSTYAGLCDMSRAVIGAGTLTVTVEAGPGGGEAFQRVLMTLRSLAPPR
jgi:hypothetical protein